MAYNPSTGIISKPINIVDVKAALGDSSNSISTLCKSSKINMWARYKPVSYAKNFDITDAERAAVNYGITIPSTIDTVAGVFADNLWGYSKPTGGIIMWSGSIDTIPSGWTLCNGSNGTPDLRDRFVMGASTWLAPGNTGGSNTTYLTAKQLPSHSHAYTTTSDDEDNGFTFTGDDGVSRYYNRYNNGLSNYQGRGSDGNNNSTVLYRTSSTGSGYAIENRPAYYALAFIMRIS